MYLEVQTCFHEEIKYPFQQYWHSSPLGMQANGPCIWVWFGANFCTVNIYTIKLASVSSPVELDRCETKINAALVLFHGYST